MEMSSTTQPPWASASNYFKGALTLPSSPWKSSSFLEKEMCHSSSRTGKDTPSHSEISSASQETFAVQEPGKNAWKAKREPQLLQLSPGRAYTQELGL